LRVLRAIVNDRVGDSGNYGGVRMRRLLGAVLRASLAGGVVIGIVGCGGGSGSTSTTTQASTTSGGQTAATAASTTTTASTATSAAASTTSGVAAPGTALAVGATATVPYQPVAASEASKPKFKLQVTVSAIEQGSLSDFNGLKLDATQKASTPYYVKVKMTNVSDGDAGGEDNPAISIEGVDKTGETQQSVTFLGEFPRCEDKEPPKPFSHGKSFETCLTFLVPGGITKAAYTSTEPYITSPVTWK
jgi:hypothetical protein